MAFIDMDTYRKACAKAEEGVDHITLREAILRVYEMWTREKKKEKKIDFHSYFHLVTLELGIEDLFDAKKYRLALAAYFQPRALMKLAKQREEESLVANGPANNVEFATSMYVRIRIDFSASIEFEATRREGPLEWRHVNEKFVVIHFGQGKVDDANRHQARRQALMVLNSVRERAAKKKVA